MLPVWLPVVLGHPACPVGGLFPPVLVSSASLGELGALPLGVWGMKQGVGGGGGWASGFESVRARWCSGVCGEARRARGGALWQMLGEQGGAEALLLSLSFCASGGLATARSSSEISDFWLVEAMASWWWLAPDLSFGSNCLSRRHPFPAPLAPAIPGPFEVHIYGP